MRARQIEWEVDKENWRHKLCYQIRREGDFAPGKAPLAVDASETRNMIQWMRGEKGNNRD